MGDKYISLFLWWDLRILIINCKIRKYADYVYKMYTKRGNNFYGSKEDKKEEDIFCKETDTHKTKRILAPFYKEIAVLVVFVSFLFFYF